MANKEVIAVIEQRATHVGIPKLCIPFGMLMQIVNFNGVERWEPEDYTDEERAQMKQWNVRVIIEAEEVSPTAGVDARRIVAYYDPTADRVVTASQMHSMLNHQGQPGKTAAQTYTVPLYADGVPQRVAGAQEGGNSDGES